MGWLQIAGTLDGCIWLTENQVDWLLKKKQTRKKRQAINFWRFPSSQWPIYRPIVYKFDGKHGNYEVSNIGI